MVEICDSESDMNIVLVMAAQDLRVVFFFPVFVLGFVHAFAGTLLKAHGPVVGRKLFV